MAAAGDDGSTVVWNITQPRSVVHLTTLNRRADPVLAVVFSPDGRVMVTGNGDGSVDLFDVAALRAA